MGVDGWSGMKVTRDKVERLMRLITGQWIITGKISIPAKQRKSREGRRREYSCLLHRLLL